ncbi:unnamed protein product [Cuscuta epithymum]|uniref:Uncharacterized protein n=1 Tax=Cuscuta epithymum TaxID=186058 RepID=A0AAV0C013_9ASTE|nr:unnamed protein product [Cuscuta epithymum]
MGSWLLPPNISYIASILQVVDISSETNQ